MWSEILTPKQWRIQVHYQRCPLLWRSEISVLCHEARWKWQTGKRNEPSEIHSSVFSLQYTTAKSFPSGITQFWLSLTCAIWKTVVSLYSGQFQSKILLLWGKGHFNGVEEGHLLNTIMAQWWNNSIAYRYRFVCYPNTFQYVRAIIVLFCFVLKIVSPLA